MNNEASKVQQSMDYVQIDWGCKQKCPASKRPAYINEGKVFKSVLLIILLLQMSRGTFRKRKPFIGAGTAELVWTASLCFSYHKNSRGFGA